MSKVLRIAVLSAVLMTVTAIPQITPLSSIVQRQTVVTDLPAQWSFFGCFQDSTSARSLSGASFANTTGMTVEACVNFCNSQSFIYAGLEFGQECYCDIIFENAEVSAPDTDCSQACVGNPAQLCGAPNRLSVYSSGTAAVFPTQVPSAGDFVALGCFNDSVSARTLQVRVDVPNLTVESCTAACFSQGFTLAGVEFGQECWCGSQILNGGAFVGNGDGISGTPPVRSSAGGPFCDTACVGNNTELCGGSNRMNLYNFTGPTAPTPVVNFLPLGCFPDHGLGPMTLRVQTFPNGGVTADTCTATCHSQGFLLAGMEAGTKCFCDTAFSFSISPVADSACNIPCVAAPSELCGGATTLTIYQFEDVTFVMNAFATLTSPADALVALINNATTLNVQTVGPQIISGIEQLMSIINTINAAALAGANSGSHPFTGVFASDISTALQNAALEIDKVFNAFGSQSAVLKPGFASVIISGIQDIASEGVTLAQNCASSVIPSFSATAFSVQTDLERTSAQVEALY